MHRSTLVPFQKLTLTSALHDGIAVGVNQIREKPNLFYQFVFSRYEKRSKIYTSNRDSLSGGDVFGDSVMASAVLDRILHHCTVINIKCESFRLRDRKKN
jgi:DNA replication protein DnaC